MSWGVFSDGRTGLSPLRDLLLESSSLETLESSFLDPLLGRLHLILSEVF